MTQAYPQFTPVQILEAGQRALADGRHDYAAQFFQHLIDHYGDTQEAAAAREAMARIQGVAAPAPYANGYAGERPAAGGNRGARQQPLQQSPGGAPPAGMRPGGPVEAPPAQAGPQQQRTAPPRQAEPPQLRREPSFGPPDREATDMPRHIARHSIPHEPVTHAPPPQPQPYAVQAQRPFVPPPEKHYIIGRVVAGLLLLVGIAGVFGGIGLLFAAFSDPKIFGMVGANGFGPALMFAVTVFIASMVLLIIAQIASAIFNGADAISDVARLERYRAGDYGDDDE